MDTTTVETKSAPAISFVGFIHEGVPCAVANLPACVKFYTEVFGLKLLPRPKALDDIGPGAWIGNDEDTVQFHLIAKDDEYCPGGDAKVAPAGRHTAWRVADIDAFCRRMTALGVTWSSQSNLIGEPQVFVQDPEGHTWEFQGVPKKR